MASRRRSCRRSGCVRVSSGHCDGRGGISISTGKDRQLVGRRRSGCRRRCRPRPGRYGHRRESAASGCGRRELPAGGLPSGWARARTARRSRRSGCRRPMRPCRAGPGRRAVAGGQRSSRSPRPTAARPPTATALREAFGVVGRPRCRARSARGTAWSRSARGAARASGPGRCGPIGAGMGGSCGSSALGGGLGVVGVGIGRTDRLLGHHRPIGRDVVLPVGILDVAGLDVRLPRVRALGHGDVVVGQQGPLGFLQGDDRDVVRRLVLGLGRDGRRVLADRVEEAVDRDPAFLVIGPLGVEPLGGGGPQPRRRLELLVVGVDFQEEPGERVRRLVDDLLRDRPGIAAGCIAPAGCWPAGYRMPSGIWKVKPTCQVMKLLYMPGF